MSQNSTLGSYARSSNKSFTMQYLRDGPKSEGLDGDVHYTITVDGVQQEDVHPDAGYNVALTVNGTGDHLALDGFDKYTARSLAQTYIKRWAIARVTIDGEPYEWEPPADTPTADNATADNAGTERRERPDWERQDFYERHKDNVGNDRNKWAGFAVDATVRAIEINMPAIERHVLDQYIKKRRGPKHKISLSQADISQMTGWKIRRISTAYKRLVACGALHQHKSWSREGNTTYIVSVTNPEKWTDIGDRWKANK